VIDNRPDLVEKRCVKAVAGGERMTHDTDGNAYLYADDFLTGKKKAEL
jgi:hypothetical protein